MVAMKRIAVLVLGSLVAVFAAAAGYLLVLSPNARPTTDLAVEATAERVQRGEYLVRHVVGCLYCHTRQDVSKRVHKAKGPEGAGGECLGPEAGIPGVVCAPNITPHAETGIGGWSDDEILRAMREGVGRDGRALFPMMPYAFFRSLSDEDAHAIVAYLRTAVEAVDQESEKTKLDFPVSWIVRTFPEPLEAPAPHLEPGDGLAYGEHLVRVAGCADCHGENLSGGVEYSLPSGVVRSANLTPGGDGIVPREFESFRRIFRAYASGDTWDGTAEDDFTVMPWEIYSEMTDADLRAIHEYLLSVPAVEKQVQTYSAAD